MSKYTGLLFPADRYHQIGPFRFAVYNDLVPGEARDIEKINKEQSQSYYKIIKLAQRIAKDKKITSQKALDIVSSLDTTKSQELIVDYVDEFESLTSDNLGETDIKIKFVTVLMRYRGEVQAPGSDEWTPTRDWTEDDTMVIPRKLLSEIYEFITWERDGWPEGKAPALPPSPTLMP